MNDDALLKTSSLFVVDVTVYQGEATIHYNKLQADPKQGKSLDIGISSTRHIHTHSLLVLIHCLCYFLSIM